MQFNSYSFILLFLPLSVAGYYLCSRITHRAGVYFLLCISVLFYAFNGITAFLLLGLSLSVNYLLVRCLNRKRSADADHDTVCRRIFLAAGVVFNCGLLFYFKYYNFAVGSAAALLGRPFEPSDIVLPLGISFYTFLQIAYLTDTYRGMTARDSLSDYLLYILYFPKILMGPLVDRQQFLKEVHDREDIRPHAAAIGSGLCMFEFGLFKKVILADSLSAGVGWCFENIGTATPGDFWVCMLAYTFQIYFDFSGYCDMACGISRMLGIELPMNFDSPYQALSIRDFWRRWHITLTRFLTQYIYIPLGGSRKGLIRTCLNTMIVFLISGIWHGANTTFILWGILHGLLCLWDRAVERSSRRWFSAGRWLCTFFAVNVLWLLFRSDSVSEWWILLRYMFGFGNMNVSDGLIAVFAGRFSLLTTLLHLENAGLVVHGFPMIMLLVVCLLICLFPQNNYRRRWHFSAAEAVVSSIALCASLICLGSASVFIYNGF